MRGAAVLADLLREMDPGSALPESELEAAFLGLLKRAGIELPRCQVTFPGVGRVDFYFPDLNLVIELDGLETHGRREQLQRDRERDNGLVVAGRRVLRFTWYDVHQRPEYVLAQLRAVQALVQPVPPAGSSTVLLP